MEAAVSSSMGAMGPVLRKLELLLAPESRLRKRVKDGIGLLKEDLEEVSSAFVDLWMLEAPNPRAKCWMEEARELSYQVDDFVDELMLMRTGAGVKIRAVSRHRVGRVKIALLPAPPRRSTRVAKIAQLRALVWQATERLERYQLEACCSSSSPMHMTMITQHRRAPALYGDAANLVGMEDSRTILIEMLTGEAEQQLKVVSIVGPAGVGKTTLAKEIFRELRGQFELWAFVHASRKIDMRRFLGSILSQVQPHHQLPSVVGTVQSLIDSIQEELRDKRYLIVIDDLWEEMAWDIVRGAFPEGNNCSRIVATTENMNVSLKCCSYMAHNILNMKPLGIQDSEYLFFNRVFGSEQQCPDELKEVSYGIIRKCCGLPLSLVHVTGLLSSIDYSELWYHVYDRLCSILNRSHTVEEIQKRILNLSYNSLPQCLKTCPLYFNMYPEGYIMWKVHVVKQWIAEGFINAAEGKDREEIAEGYFEELVNRGMVLPMRIDYNDEVLSCTVHHIIFDLINHNSKEEEFIAAIDYSQPITGLSAKAHRLSFRLSSAKYAKQPARITMSQLRSLGFFGFIKCMPPIVEFKHLRVLVLDFWGSHDRHMSLNLSRICILFQLRYLKISGDIMVELPAQMRGLHYLETLEINARLSAVPLDIVHLPSLLHLGLRAGTKLPDGIGHIKSLSTLLYFDLRCNSEDNIRSLGQLTNLRHLHLTCSAVLSSDHLKRKLIPLAFSLGKLGNLKSLTLTPDALRTAILFDVSSGISSPPIFLQRLELLPPICFFSRLPTRFGELHKLRILKIVVKELHGNDISNISELPSLTVFSLYVRRALTGTVVFSAMAFGALKYFKFTCGVMCLAFQAGAMPNLQRVKLCFNAHRGQNHNRVLDGIEHLSNLQEVVGRIGVLPGADESDWSVVKLSFEDIIRKHPRCPRFNSQPIDFIEEEYPPLDKFHLRQHEGSSSEHEILEKSCAKDMDKHIDSRLFREFDLPPSSGTSYHHKSDEYSELHMLVSILRDESAEPTTLDLSLLEDITNNFTTEQEVDQGGFGMVYKGILGDGIIIAVKRLCGPHETVDMAYIFNCLMTVKHSNIVRFLGYWEPQPNAIKKWGSDMGIEQQDMLLCFEYLHNGSLRSHITEESCGLEWHTCYQIIKGICQGLDYLHKNSIIHLHLKPENILLDANMVPKIADYAYARLLGEDRPTPTQEIVTLLDYVAPEYHENGAISLKSDLYSLGVIITQMVAGHKDHSNIKSVLGGWRSRLESDTSWRNTALETAYRQVILCIEMGKSCMHRDPSKRPCIRDIIDRFAEMETSEASVTGGVRSPANNTKPETERVFKSMDTEFIPVSSRKKFIPVVRSGGWADIGPRHTMEDVFICCDNFMLDFGFESSEEGPSAFYGVFDGHGGKHAADFVCSNLPRFIVEDERFPREIVKVVSSAFLQVDAAFADACSLNCSLASGTTALAALVVGRSLLVANAGDCRAVLCRRGKAIEMSRDHKPSCIRERMRIEALGGYVNDGYLNGQLGVARAIGNWHMKGMKASDGLGPLSAEPEVMTTDLTEEDEFLIMGCDGIWDVFSSQNAVNFARCKLQEHNDPAACCKELVDEAIKRDSGDNLSVVVVCFNSRPPPVLTRPSVQRSISAEGLRELQSFLEKGREARRRPASMKGSAAEELEAAERVVMRWDSAASSVGGGGDDQMLFDGATDRAEAERFLRAVDDLRRLAPPLSPASAGSQRRASPASGGAGACTALQVAMARLENEFCYVLSARALDLEIEALVGLSSLPMSSGDRRNSDATEAAAAGDDDDSSVSSSSVGRRSSYRSLQSIREIDLFPADAIADLHAIASRMAAAGYGRECVKVYASVRKPAIDAALRRLGVEKLSIGDVQRLEWNALEAKIRRWIRAAPAAVRGVFASERRLCFHIFHDLPLCTSTAIATAADDTPFAEAVKGAALQLFGFAEAISIGRRSPEKLFKIIDLHDALSDLLPDISDLFAASKAAESIYVQAAEIRSRLADAVRGILSEFENAVLRDPSKTPVPGGTIHPLTRYVMNYSTLILDYKTTLSELIISRLSASSRTAAKGNEATPAFPDLDTADPDSQLPLATHLVWIIVVLEHNLESKASLYKDAALSHLFLMNNVHYIVHKVKDSAELRGLIGDEYLKRLTGKFRQAATSYQRTAWLKILNCLRDEGLHVSGGFSSGISISALRERFKAFNAAFEEAHKVQSVWYVPDTQLREELRISISEKLLPAYRSFLGRFRHHIENSRHPELYIKYTVEDLEILMADFFEGSPPHRITGGGLMDERWLQKA